MGLWGFPLRPSSNGHVLMPVKMPRQRLCILHLLYAFLYQFIYIFYNYVFDMILTCVEYGLILEKLHELY